MKGPLFFIARRYIAGTVRSDAIETVKRLNHLNISATIDNLGENVKTASEAAESVNEYLSLLDDIQRERVDSTISMKLTHLGIDLSAELALENASKIVEKALEYRNFVRLDMESSAYTQGTLDILGSLRKKYPNVGVAIQSYLYRSASDIKRLTKEKTSVRLVKGAYKEPPDIAFRSKKDVDENYSRLMKELLLKGVRTAIATHDEKLIDEAVRFTNEKDIPKKSFEFQMLLGIKRSLQKKLAEEGYTVRVYVPYGPEWMAYTLRRFRERKENIFFVLRNIFD